MPFTQQEIDHAWRVMCDFGGTTPEELGIQAPLIGSIPVDEPAPGAIEAVRRAITSLWKR